MATTDTNVPQVIVNKLTQAQYEAAVKDPTEFYAVTDGQIETADIANGAVTADKIDFTSYNGFTQPANLTNVTLTGSYATDDLSGWTITIPSSVSGAKYFVEAVSPYVNLGTNYKMLSLAYSDNTEFATFVEDTGSNVGLRVSGIATGTGSNLEIKVRIQINGSGTTTGRIDGGYIRWTRIA